MPRDMFGDVIHPVPGLGARSRSAVSMSLVGHALFAALVIIVPLMATHEMPGTLVPPVEVTRVFVRPEPLPADASTSSQSPQPAQQTTETARVPAPAPSDAPTHIAPETGSTTSIGHPHGTPGAPLDGAIGSSGPVPRLPEVPSPPQVTVPVRPGGVIKTPTKVRHVPPIYPPIAQQARVEGVVIIEAVIGVDGRVKEARVLRSKPLLDEAALDAVRQWQFTPTTLNGVPVPVIMTVTVNFTLN